MAQAKKNNSKNKKSNGTESRARQKAREIQEKRKADKRVVDEIWAIITIALGIFFAVSVFTNGAGKLGEVLSGTMKGLFGHIAMALPFILIIFGILLFAKATSHFNIKTFLLFVLMLFMICTAWSVHFVDGTAFKFSMLGSFFESGKTLESGGMFGMAIASLLVRWLGEVGSYIFTVAAIIICLLLIINTPISRGLRAISDKMEERRLIKEHAHLDDDYEPVATPVQAKNEWPEIKKPSAAEVRAEAKKPIKMSSGKEEVYVPLSPFRQRRHRQRGT